MTPTRSHVAWASLVMAHVWGCATYTQDDSTPGPGDDGGAAGSDAAGKPSTDGGAAAGSPATGGVSAGGASAKGGAAGVTFGGAFTTAGTSAGGTGGASNGGAPGGSGGKGGGGGSGGAAGGMGGKGGTGDTGGQSGAACSTGKLTPLAASDGGNSENPPQAAIDGSPDTRWDSVHMDDAAYLQLDLGEAVTINRVSILWQNSYATDYKLQIADNAAGPFTDLYEDKAGNGGTDDVTTPTLKLGRGRYVRMQGVTRHTQNYGYSIYEMTVYGDRDETCK